MERRAATGDSVTGEAVIEACQAGDRDAFRLLFERHKDRVYSVALYFFGGAEATAHDITRQVFLKLFTSIAQFQGEAEFSTWLYRVTTNACLDEREEAAALPPLRRGEGLARAARGEFAGGARGGRGGRRHGAERRGEALPDN